MPSRRIFLKSGLGLTAAGVFAPALSAASTLSDASLSAGAGRADVLLGALYPLDDFAGEHDPLAVRVLLLERAGQRQAIAVIDLTSITAEMIARMKKILTELAGVAPEQAIVFASHSFSTPHIFAGSPQGAAAASQGKDAAHGEAALLAFETALQAATRQALTVLQPARLAAGSGFSRIGVNRNIATPYGWWLGADDAGFSDPHIGVVRIDAQDGKPLAILMNVAVQPAVMDASERLSGGRLVSADLAGAAVRHVEAHYGGAAVALFLEGAAGDQVPYLQASRHIVHADGSVGRIDMHEAGFALVDLFGQRLGDEVIRVAQTCTVAASGGMTLPLKMRRETVTLTGQVFSPRQAPTGPLRSYHYQRSGPVTMPVVLMQWGDVALVGVQPEFSAIIGARIRAASPYANTLITTMADGAAKYLPDAAGYDALTYEARSSPFFRGSAELAADAIIGQLIQMKHA